MVDTKQYILALTRYYTDNRLKKKNMAKYLFSNLDKYWCKKPEMKKQLNRIVYYFVLSLFREGPVEFSKRQKILPLPKHIKAKTNLSGLIVSCVPFLPKVGFWLANI